MTSLLHRRWAALVLLLSAAVVSVHGFVPQSSLRPGVTSPSLKPPRLPSTSLAAISSKKVELTIQSNNFLRGKLLLVMSKFLIPPKIYIDAFARIWSNTYWPEVAMIVAMLNAETIGKWFYLWQGRAADQKKELVTQRKVSVVQSSQGAFDEEKTERLLKEFATSKTKKLALGVQQFGRLQGTLYVMDVFLVFLRLIAGGCLKMHTKDQSTARCLKQLEQV